MRFQKRKVCARFARFSALFMGGLALAAFAFGLTPAHAESLKRALASTYVGNPTLNAERAALRAIDEEISQARSNFRPSLSGDLDTGYRNTNPKSKSRATTRGLTTGGGTHHPKNFSLTLSKSLFRGFRTLNAIREAEATIQSGRATLRNVEQSVLLDAVTAYMDVFRDQAIVRLRESNVRVLSEQQKATKDRFEVGEVTKTDVAQAEARRSGAVSDLNLAQSNLKTSRAAYQRVIGHPPSNLVEPQSIESLLPHVLQVALSTSEAENPIIVAAIYTEKASRYAVKQIIGEMLPELSVEATISDSLEPSVSLERDSERRITGRLRVPLYTRGEPSSRARQARQTNAQRRREIDEARRQAKADVIAAWGRLIAARAQIESDQAQVRANKIALNGVKEEEKVGQRTLLDVLDAEQELLDSQVALVSTQRDRVVAAYTLLSAIGRMDAHFLRLPVEHYDPMEYYDKIKHKLFGTYADRQEREQYRRERITR